jgi:hypothetical protein
MSETAPANLPPDPMSQAKSRMAELAGETAKDMAWRATVRQIKQYVPRMFWPLIPGEGGSVQENAKGAASRWLWGLVSSVIISGLFFAVFAVAISGFLVVLAYAVLTSM